jgi:hypothetical protein
MCRVEYAEPWECYRQQIRRARWAWICCECRRTIASGEEYVHVTGRSGDSWREYRWCRHCEAAAAWMVEVCGGHMIEELLEELVEHWEEGFRSIPFGRLIVAMKRRWHGGADPVPTGVRELAQEMLARQVAV